MLPKCGVRRDAELCRLCYKQTNKQTFFCFFLATYAAAVLFRMSDEKGGEYTKRLSQELRSTLYQRDLHNQLWNGDVPPPDLQVSGA